MNIKLNLKSVICFVLILVICCSVTAYAAVQYSARDINFVSKNPTFTSTNVEDAMDTLYNESQQKKNYYSSEETVVGTWIDGKPIYRKVINFGALPNNDTKEVESGISNIENLVNIWGISYRKSDNVRRPIPYNYTTQTFEISIYLVNSKILIYTGTDRSDENAYVYLEYTKTTD